MTIESSLALRNDIQLQVDSVMQVKCGQNINTLIEEVSKTNFDKLAKEHQKEKEDRTNDSNIRYWFTIATLSISVVAVVCAVASIIFTTGLYTAGAYTAAIVTGFVGVTTAFTLFDKAIYRYLNYDLELKKKKTTLGKLEKKFDDIKSLIQTRMKTLANIEKTAVKSLRANEIFNQITRVNNLLEKVKKQVPNKIIRFTYIDASPLLQYT